MNLWSSYLICAAWMAGAVGTVASEQLAFPGAEGFGRLAKGGRGGEIYHVTNLNDSGHGSLRDAVSKGPRIVVFEVGGYIELKSILHIGSHITIAGQTAPGDGIGTKNYEVSLSDSKDVIVRYIRFRQGLTPNQNKKSAVNITQGSDIILDHVSIEWGRWDTVDMNKCSNITFQYSIIGEGIAPQRFGCLCQSDNVTFSHNLWINHHSRNPKSKGKVQFINNVIYNWQLDAYIAGASHGENWHDVIGNYFIEGPNTGKHGAFDRGNDKTHIYAKDNYLDDNKDGKLDGALIPEKELGPVTVEKEPFASAPVSIDNAADAYRKVAAGAGCSLHRDSVDTRLIEDLKSLGKRGKIISDPDEVGGFGELKTGTNPVSSIGDGIPDNWKAAHGLDSKDAATAHGDYNHDGYTNIEKYVNDLAGAGAAK